jgi:TonB family protein
MCRSKRRAPSLVGLAVALVTSLAAVPAAQAQAGADASKAKTELSPTERAQRDADKVFQWIRFHADKPGAKPAIILPGQGAAAPAPAPAAVAAKPNNNRAPERNADAAGARRTAAAGNPDRRGITETVADVAAEASRAESTAALSPEATQLAAASLSATNVPAVLPETLVPTPAPAAAAAVFAEPPPVVETPLKAIKMVEPEFPRQLQSTLRAGTVQVRFTVLPDGSVGRAEAIQTTHRRLNTAALEAVNQWRFEPIAKAREATVELVFRVE